MAQRPVFIPNIEGQPVIIKMIEFSWNPGFSKVQKQKNVEELHRKAKEHGIFPVLEISTKSTNDLGKNLSAFNLQFSLNSGKRVSVEAAFQSSKVFEFGGPYIDMLNLRGKRIKKDERLKNSGKLIYFLFENSRWDLEPKSAFYDWLYIKALIQNPTLSEKLFEYNGFTDIEFNPKRQINCQAHSAALFVSLSKKGILDKVIKTEDSFLDFLFKNYNLKEKRRNIQTSIFDLHNFQESNKILNILSNVTNEFIYRHWNKNELKSYKVPKWIKLSDLSNKKIRNEYGCFVLVKNEHIKLIGQPYIKFGNQKETLYNFGEIIDNFLLKQENKKYLWNDFDEIYILPIEKDVIYLSKSIKEYLITKGISNYSNR